MLAANVGCDNLQAQTSARSLGRWVCELNILTRLAWQCAARSSIWSNTATSPSPSARSRTRAARTRQPFLYFRYLSPPSWQGISRAGSLVHFLDHETARVPGIGRVSQAANKRV